MAFLRSSGEPLRIPIRGYETPTLHVLISYALLRIPIRGYEYDFQNPASNFHHVTNPYKGL